MKNVSLILLLGCLLLQSGCTDSNISDGLVVYVTDTIKGRSCTIPAKVGENGKFNNSISKDNKTHAISGQITKSDDKYIVEIDYSYTSADSSETKQIETRMQLQEGQPQILAGQVIAGDDKDITYIKISNK